MNGSCRRTRVASCGLLVSAIGFSACASRNGSGHAAMPLAGADSTAAARAVEAVVRDSFFRAIARSDYAGMGRALAPGFELDEDTLRLSGEQFVALVQGFAGKATIAYRLDGFNTRVHGATAWTSYRNHGTFTPTGGQATPLEWLETAVLVRDAASVWRIDRLHSTSIRPAR